MKYFDQVWFILNQIANKDKNKFQYLLKSSPEYNIIHDISVNQTKFKGFYSYIDEDEFQVKRVKINDSLNAYITYGLYLKYISDTEEDKFKDEEEFNKFYKYINKYKYEDIAYNNKIGHIIIHGDIIREALLNPRTPYNDNDINKIKSSDSYETFEDLNKSLPYETKSDILYYLAIYSLKDLLSSKILTEQNGTFPSDFFYNIYDDKIDRSLDIDLKDKHSVHCNSLLFVSILIAFIIRNVINIPNDDKAGIKPARENIAEESKDMIIYRILSFLEAIKRPVDFKKVKAINEVAKFIENDSNFFKDEEMVQLYKIQMLGMNSFYKD